jgi:hypothetical protein
MLLQVILLPHNELFPILKQLFGAFAKLRKAMGRRLQDVKEVFTSLVKQTNKVRWGEEFITVLRTPYSDNEYVKLGTYNFEILRLYIAWYNSNN